LFHYLAVRAVLYFYFHYFYFYYDSTCIILFFYFLPNFLQYVSYCIFLNSFSCDFVFTQHNSPLVNIICSSIFNFILYPIQVLVVHNILFLYPLYFIPVLVLVLVQYLYICFNLICIVSSILYFVPFVLCTGTYSIRNICFYSFLIFTGTSTDIQAEYSSGIFFFFYSPCFVPVQVLMHI
jgi:hypothetical protein